jgi:hypothetical protein
MNSKNIVDRVKLENKDEEEFQMIELMRFYRRIDYRLDIEYLRYPRVSLERILEWQNCINMKVIWHREIHKEQMGFCLMKVGEV